MSEHDIPKQSGAKLDFSNSMSYGDYLALDQILSAQHRLSDHHDEMLFIIQHQTNELWMKLILHEMNAARASIADDNLSPAFKMLARVCRIMEQLVNVWTVLSTLTPAEYVQFRDVLGNASGFQSYQYRLIEFMMGYKHEAHTRPFKHQSDLYAVILAELSKPSLYDEAIQLLARNGLAIDGELLARDWTVPYVYNASVEEAWLTVYREPEKYWELYELGEKLLDLEDSFKQWQFRHFTTVRRVIGFKRGTGGTSGVGYLKSVLELELFPELWKLRTSL